MKNSPSSKRKAKVARGIARLNIGGPSRQACFLHTRLADTFETVLITGRLDEGEGDMSFLLESDRGVYQLGSMSRPLKFWDDLVSAFRFYRILRKERPDILHTHTAKAGALGRVAALFARTPLRVHTYHGHVFSGYFPPLKTKAFIAIERMLNCFTDRVIAISQSQATDLCELYKVVPRNKVTVVRTGHDLSAYEQLEPTREFRQRLGLPLDAIIVVWAGRMVPIKNVGLLAQVIRNCVSLPDLHFAIVGDGSDRHVLEESIGNVGNVTLLGWHSDMANIWKAADIALGTSINEGTPAAFIEAMAAGKPFVSTAVGGVVDLTVAPVADRRGCIEAANCMLAPPSAEVIVECLRALATNAELRKRMGTAGRKFVFESYDREMLSAQITDLYQELLS